MGSGKGSLRDGAGMAVGLKSEAGPGIDGPWAFSEKPRFGTSGGYLRANSGFFGILPKKRYFWPKTPVLGDWGPKYARVCPFSAHRPCPVPPGDPSATIFGPPTPLPEAAFWPKRPKMGEIGRKWAKLAENGQNWPKLAKLVKIGQNWPKTAKISPN